jgi:hypothetical protein
MNTFGSSTINFFSTLKPDFNLPKEVSVLNPFKNNEVKKIVGEFYTKFYNDNNERILILGINPGRFGAGVTGIAFTDPVRLASDCGIENSFENKSELSSTFIYEVIRCFGHPNSFYSKFFLGAVCPLGFTKHGKNLNYYDDPGILKSTTKFILESIQGQIKLGASNHLAICLGEGKNYSYLSKLNDLHGLFKEIVPLAHPRFIMQYKRKELGKYVTNYVRVLKSASAFINTGVK